MPLSAQGLRSCGLVEHFPLGAIAACSLPLAVVGHPKPQGSTPHPAHPFADSRQERKEDDLAERGVKGHHGRQSSHATALAALCWEGSCVNSTQARMIGNRHSRHKAAGRRVITRPSTARTQTAEVSRKVRGGQPLDQKECTAGVCAATQSATGQLAEPSWHSAEITSHECTARGRSI
ncbi:MAG: hypothetical protein J3K34DRAFT_158905 [Monoraphidium minutum]|nr:MAG: hypothetical protein J3K34DRAFT_158905 [Monoraphidium minutum]